MALTNFGPFAFPTPLIPPTSAWGTNATVTLDASGEKAAFVGRVPKTGDIAAVTFRLGTTTTGDTLKVSLQDVDSTTGFPDEVVDQSNTVVVANADDNVFKRVVMGSNRAVTAGDLLAVVIEFNAFVAGNLNILTAAPLLSQTFYTAAKTGGGPTWSKQQRDPLIVLEYDDGSRAYIPNVYPGNLTSIDYASNTALADEYGLLMPMPACRVSGMGWYGRLGAAADLVLYDTDGSTPLETFSFDSDNQANAAQDGERSVRFAPRTLTAGDYRVVLKPTTTTSVRMNYIDCNAAADLDQLSGGSGFKLTRRVDAGSWTNVDTQRPMVWLLVDQIHDGTSSGEVAFFTMGRGR